MILSDISLLRVCSLSLSSLNLHASCALANPYYSTGELSGTTLPINLRWALNLQNYIGAYFEILEGDA